MGKRMRGREVRRRLRQMAFDSASEGLLYLTAFHLQHTPDTTVVRSGSRTNREGINDRTRIRMLN
jgi:hypothetical protein